VGHPIRSPVQVHRTAVLAEPGVRPNKPRFILSETPVLAKR
jgi:hypothetical protein